MSGKDRRKVVVLSRVKDGLLSLRKASEALELSYRQAKRLLKRYREGGEAGLMHRGRARANHQHDPELKRAVVNRYRERYRGFGPTLAAEKLVEEDGLSPISRETLRLWLLEAGLWHRHRRRGPYRSRREPRAHFGELVQLDGSFHQWFGEEHPRYCLMNLVDDATGTTLALMSAQETSEAAMRILGAWIQRYGIPMQLYCDLRSVYVSDLEPTVEQQLKGKRPLTAFGSACERLGIQIISAYSPQAKGRVERKHGVYQDRFVKELVLRGAKTISEANLILQGGFIEKLNKKFAHAPADPQDFHVGLRGNQDLRDLLCFEQVRSVGQDWVVRHQNRFYQLVRGQEKLPRPTSQVIVREWLDGSIHILHRGKKVQFRELEAPPVARQKVV